MSLPFSPHIFIVTGHNPKIILKTFQHQTAMLALFFWPHFVVLGILLFASVNAWEGLEISTCMPLTFLLLQQVGSFEFKKKYVI